MISPSEGPLATSSAARRSLRRCESGVMQVRVVCAASEALAARSARRAGSGSNPHREAADGEVIIWTSSARGSRVRRSEAA